MLWAWSLPPRATSRPCTASFAAAAGGRCRAWSCKGKTLGIVGLGGIGREMARLAHGIGLEGHRLQPVDDPNPPVPMVTIDELLAAVGHREPASCPERRDPGLPRPERLARTKPGVIIVNTARAGVVDEGGAGRSLRSGHIGHYATDVFAKEPGATDEPLLKLDNVTLTAHAGYNTPEAAMTMYRRAIDLATAG